MLSVANRVLEVGYGDAFPAPIILQEVKSLHEVDIDPVFIEDIGQRQSEKWPFTVAVHDMLAGPLSTAFDAAYRLGVLERIAQEKEELFLRNVCNSLTEKGVLMSACRRCSLSSMLPHSARSATSIARTAPI